MRSWILVFAFFSLALVGVMADEASLATVRDESNFMQEAADARDYLAQVNFDEDRGFNLTIPRSAIIAARKLSVSVPLLLSGNGVNTFFRHCYCFRRLSSGKSLIAKTKLFCFKTVKINLEMEYCCPKRIVSCMICRTYCDLY